VNDNDLTVPTSLGLKPHHYQLIKDVVLTHELVTHAWIFGSRALGTYRDNSDIDIAIEGTAITLTVVADMQARLEQSSLPFKVDFVVKHRITSSELLAHIENYGLQLK
jgi:predicted nucleotidyltransferase